MLELNKLSKVAYENAKQREQNGARIKAEAYNMLKHCATEVIEAQQALDDWQEELKFGSVSLGVTDPEFVVDAKKHFADELADIVCCVLIIASRHEIDIEQAINDCIERNRKRAMKIGDKL